MKQLIQHLALKPVVTPSTSRAFRNGLLSAAAFLILLDVLVEPFVCSAKQSWLRLFWLTDEGNIPTLFAGLLWLLVAAGAARCYLVDHRRSLPDARFWLLIALAFCCAFLEETVCLHERWDEFVKLVVLPTAWNSSRWFLTVWAAWYAPLLALFLGIILPFLWQRSSSPARLSLVLSVVLFASSMCIEFGAQMTFLTSWLQNNHRLERLVEPLRRVLYIAEEGAENAGAIAFLFVLTEYLALAEPQSGRCKLTKPDAVARI